jgi:hypothetical protein
MPNLLNLSPRVSNTGNGVLYSKQTWPESLRLRLLKGAINLGPCTPQKKEEFSRKTQELLSASCAYSL